jgi:hypothetical protein
LPRATTLTFREVSVQLLGLTKVLHTKKSSTVQAEEQPSRSKLFPSSQASPGAMRIPSPQTGRHWLLVRAYPKSQVEQSSWREETKQVAQWLTMEQSGAHPGLLSV